MQVAQDDNVFCSPFPHVTSAAGVERDTSSQQSREGAHELTCSRNVPSPRERLFALRSRGTHAIIVRMFDSRVQARAPARGRWLSMRSRSVG